MKRAFAANRRTEPKHDTLYGAWADGTVSALQPHALPNGCINLTQDLGE